MDDEVSVAQLLEREGWNEDAPHGPGSRIRILAVMGAVVLGCGIAAMLVRPGPDDEAQALWPEETSVIELPGAPTGGGLPGAVSVTATVAGSESAGPTSSTESEVEPTADDPVESSAASSTGNPADPGVSSSAPADSSTNPRDDLPDSSEQSSPKPSPSTTISSSTSPPDDDDDDNDDDCWFPIFC